MNRLRGRIAAVESNGHMSLVDVAVGGQVFTATLLETPATATYLEPGKPVMLLFKETEMSLAKGLAGDITLRNRFKSTVTGIERGSIMSEVRLDYGGHALASIVTTRSVDRLALAVGDTVEGLVKANEMVVAHDV